MIQRDSNYEIIAKRMRKAEAKRQRKLARGGGARLGKVDAFVQRATLRDLPPPDVQGIKDARARAFLNRLINSIDVRDKGINNG